MHPKELQEMKNRELELKRQKRIEAGIEDTIDVEPTFSTTEETTTSNYVLTTDLGEEITIINMKEDHSGDDEIRVPVSVLDENGSIISTNTIVTRYNSNTFQSGHSSRKSIIINVKSLKDVSEIQMEN